MPEQLVAAPGTVREALIAAATQLRHGGVERPERDARVLMRHCLGIDMAALIAAERDTLASESAARFQMTIERRAGGEPVSRIIGERAFFGHRLRIDAHVLDPRPETELLVEAALRDFGLQSGPKRFVDIGTGSGAIALAILAERPGFRAIATDISKNALACALENAELLGLASRFRALQGDLLDGVGGGFDFIVSNPPYIASAEIASLAPEVREHDPLHALDGGGDGLDFYRHILARAGEALVPDGRLYLEAGAGQAPSIRQIARSTGWRSVGVVQDAGGVDRVLVFAQ